jgi:hypothetical protein
MKPAACLAGALLILAATPAPADDCEQYRRMAETARRNSNSGLRDNDQAQRAAAAQYERLYNHCRQRSSGGGGVATPSAASIPQYTPPPVIDNSRTYNNMADQARKQSAGMDMSMPGPAAHKPGSTFREARTYFDEVSRSPNSCLRDLGSAGVFLVDSAESCRADGASLVSAERITSLPRNFLNADDPARWRDLGDGTMAPICRAQMKVETQRESFSECLRVYMCAMYATSCSIRRIQASGDHCEQHVAECMAENPIPESMAASPQRKPWPNTQPLRNVPAPAAVDRGRGTISGPSQGGGGSPSSATSAR